MSEETKNMIVPKLRFPEFQKEEGWKKKEFNQLFEFGNGKDYKHLSKGEIPVYGSGGYMLSVNDYLYDGESVCIGRKGTIDKPLFLSGKFWVVDTLFYTHSFKGSLPKFIYSVFQNINWLNYNEAGGIPSLAKTTISKIEVYIPKPNEQQKIADCLSSLDELITSQSQKLEELKAHKKGLMQQLFPAEGETVPKLKFEEFESCGEWEVKLLNEIAEIKRGAASQHLKYVVDETKGIRLLRINDFISNDPVYVEDTVAMKKFRVKTGDLLIAGTGATAGITFIVTEKFNNRAYSYNAPRIRVNRANNHFVYYYLKSDSILQQQRKLFVGNAQPFLDTTAIGSFELSIPSPSEQQKIADCLSSLDDLITAQTEKVEELKMLKKGLMQGLFPKVDIPNFVTNG